MSVLLNMAMFPLDNSENKSKSKEVSEIIQIIRDSGFKYQLTSMATNIETNTLRQALDLIEKCYNKLEEVGCKRVYSTLTFDIRKDYDNRIEGKIKSVEEHIGKVSK